VQAFFSILDGGKRVPLHEGPYLGYLRVHLGIKMPGGNPPALIVDGRKYVWREGEAMMFDDTWPHEVVIPSTSHRVGLIVGVLRPLPWNPAALNGFTIFGRARATYYRHMFRRVQASSPISTI
jgi:aspartyl/asparaginyl beta-hydroxylase (cupin superfamily)